MIKRAKLKFNLLLIINILVIVISILVCLLLSPLRLPGINFLGVAPHWLLIWLVSWSSKRPVGDALIAGIALGMIQDGMTHSEPSHVLPLAIVGVLTAKLQKQRYIEEDFISIALIVFVMVIVAETVTAVQYVVHRIHSLELIWTNYQHNVLICAIITSLWAPVLHYPLNLWWQKLDSVKSK